jgi:hypothetical protein
VANILTENIFLHAEYLAFSGGENFSPDTASHKALIIPMQTAALPGGIQSEPLFTRTF